VRTADPRFPKTHLLRVHWRGLPVKIANHPRRWRPSYHRFANAALLQLLFWNIIWRRPWLPQAAYAQGWDACWREIRLEAVRELKQDDIAIALTAIGAPAPN